MTARVPLARLSSLRACQRQGKPLPVRQAEHGRVWHGSNPLRVEAERLARLWLAELEQWQADGEQVPDRLLAEARKRAGVVSGTNRRRGI